MTATAQPDPTIRISAGDRLGFTLFLALALHVIFILGVGFTQSNANQPEALPSLDIILANTNSHEQPEDADYLAQTNQIGGGNQEEKARPSAAVSAPTPIDQQGLADRSQQRKLANQVKLEQIYFLSQREASELIAQAEKIERNENQQNSADSINQQQRDIASLRAEIRKLTNAYAKRPREIALTANTREAVEAGYLAQWVKKIEHIGNLNYPTRAETEKINGQLRLNVRINAAGEVLDVKISRSSGKTLLDEAAKRIVRLAEPFAPFPTKLKDKADQIVIVRTWEFVSNKLTTKDS
ncbi:MAG: TonB family protein [Gammaproteobacteria bacterium]|nr:TonB family protein [Gammaproteobacteria bacterium]